MKKVILYIAVSLDGYIADSQGAVSWIKGQDEKAGLQDTYTPFFATIDTVLMGRATYDQIVNELSPDTWPYTGAVTYVLTHRPMADTTDIKFINDSPSRLADRLRLEEGKDIWVCGGADIINQLLTDDLIDRFHLAIIPTLLGNGTRLFGTTYHPVRLRLTHTLHYNGLIEAVYERA